MAVMYVFSNFRAVVFSNYFTVTCVSLMYIACQFLHSVWGLYCECDWERNNLLGLQPNIVYWDRLFCEGLFSVLFYCLLSIATFFLVSPRKYINKTTWFVYVIFLSLTNNTANWKVHIHKLQRCYSTQASDILLIITTSQTNLQKISLISMKMVLKSLSK